jgi:hypothetical protein
VPPTTRIGSDWPVTWTSLRRSSRGCCPPNNAALELVAGLVDLLPLTSGGRDLDNYLPPIVCRLGHHKLPEVFARKLYQPYSTTRTGRSEPAPWRTPNLSVRLTGSYAKRPWMEQLRCACDNADPLDPGSGHPVRLDVGYAWRQIETGPHCGSRPLTPSPRSSVRTIRQACRAARRSDRRIILPSVADDNGRLGRAPPPLVGHSGRLRLATVQVSNTCETPRLARLPGNPHSSDASQAAGC